jgi:hypothetical protein
LLIYRVTTDKTEKNMFCKAALFFVAATTVCAQTTVSTPDAFAAFVTTVGNAVVSDYVDSVDGICTHLRPTILLVSV